MAQNPELSVAERAETMLLHNMGHSNRQIAEKLGISYGESTDVFHE